MSQRLRWLSLSTLTIATAVAAVAAPAPAAAQQPKDVEVALVVPLSGPWARQGQLERMGAEMAIDDINKSGGIKSLGGAKMKLILLDTGDSAEKAKNAAQRLVAQNPDVVGGVGAWLSSFTLAVTEVTERAELPWLTLSYSDVITGRGFRYVFQTSATGDRQSELALPAIMELAEKTTGKKPTTTGVIQDNTAAPVSFMKPMRAGGFEKAGLKILVDETYTPPLSDATPLVSKVRTLRPDFMWVISTSIPDDSLLIQKFSEMGIGPGKLPIVGNGAHFGAPELLKVAGGDVLEGTLITVANWSNDGQRQLIDEFKKRTGEPWLTQDSLCAYGHVWILKEAVEKAGVADRRKVADAIRAMDTSEGPARYFAGNHIKFDDKGRRVDAPLVIFQWRDGVPVTVYPQGPGSAKPRWAMK
ncbi:MAG TPA: ABC transporter substrate-binding protein [Xanthobacteraceae bacterium]|nr:ABC transporter substrate-binding protein [Xanthobacteraceae bacterium]